MALIKYREIARRIQLEGREETLEHFREALMEGVLNPDDFSLRDLAEATVFTRDGDPCGREWVASFNPRRGESLMEDASALDSTAFSLLTGQIVFASVMKAATAQEFIYPKLERVRSTTKLKETTPGLTGIEEDMEDDIHEQMEYPQVGFGTQYLETPLTAKKGRMLSITKEAILHDQTGLVTEGAKAIGGLLGRRREKSFCRALIGATNNYKWNGTTYSTYQTSAPWINVKASNGISTADGWVKVDAAEQLFNDMVDPYTNEPVVWGIKHIIHMPQRRHQWRRVIGASEIRSSQNTGANHDAITSANTVENYPLLSSRWLYNEIVRMGESAANAMDWWFAGDAQEMIEWIENWPITTVQAPPNSEAEFRQDIVMQFKTSMKGVHHVKEPRAMTKNYLATSL